jgi:hypothetical protein
MSLCELATDLDTITLTYEDIASCWHLECDTLSHEILDRDDIIRELDDATRMSCLDFLLAFF